MELPEWWTDQAQLILNSYRRWIGQELIERQGSAGADAARLFAAPFVVVSHGTQPDPVLNYANHTALTLWELDIQTLLVTPSRKTAEPMHRDERAQLLERTSQQGFVDDYQGIRISSSGRRFRIDRATVWNLVDDQGKPAGQAATFAEWVPL